MKITYDSEADSLYIELNTAEVAETELISESGNVNADVDQDGNLVGVEIIGVTQALPQIESVSGIEIPQIFSIPA